MTEDEDAKTKKEIFLECAARLRIENDAESNNRQRAQEELEFADGDQWPDDIARSRLVENRPSLTLNHTNTMVRRVVNGLRQQRPRIKAHPVGDGADVDTAETVNGLVRHIENQSDASVAYDTGGESSVRIGWGYWRVMAGYIDEKSFDQELYIKPFRNSFVVHMDPSSVCPDGSDSDWVIIEEKMKRTEYKRRYKDAPNVEWRGFDGDSTQDWDSEQSIRLAEYYRIVYTKEKLYRLENGDTMLASDFAPGHLVKALKSPAKYGFAVGTNGEAIWRMSAKRQLQWHRINGKEVVDSRDLPGHWIPVIRCQGNVMDIDGEVKRKGMIRDLMDPARMLNYWETMKTEVLALSPKAPWTMAEGQDEGHPEWDDANQRSYSRLVWKPVAGPNGELLPPPQRQPGVPISQGLVDACQGAEHTLLAVAGMPHEPQQDQPGQVVSGVALRQRQALSDISHFQYYDNQKLAIAHTGRILLNLIPYYYDTPRMQRIIGDDGVPKMVQINQTEQVSPGVTKVKNDLTAGRYAVVMDSGPGYETKRQEGAEALMQLLPTPLGEVISKVGADLVLRGLDVQYADELADRLMTQTPQGLKDVMESLPKQAQNIVNALQQQNQQLQQTVTQLQNDLKIGLTKSLHEQATKLQIEHLHDKRAEKDTETDAKVKQFDTELRAHTALAVAEIGAGKTLLHEHVKGAYAERAAERMESTAEHAEQ